MLVPYRSFSASIRLSLVPFDEAVEGVERGTFQDVESEEGVGRAGERPCWFSNRLRSPSVGTDGTFVLVGVVVVCAEAVEADSPSSVPSPFSNVSTARTPTIRMGTKLGSVALVDSVEFEDDVNLNILKKFIALLGDAWFALCSELDSSAASRPLRRPAKNPSKEVSEVGFENEVGTVSDGGEVPNMFLRKGLLPALVRSFSTKEEAVAVAAIASRRAKTVAWSSIETSRRCEGEEDVEGRGRGPGVPTNGIEGSSEEFAAGGRFRPRKIGIGVAGLPGAARGEGKKRLDGR